MTKLTYEQRSGANYPDKATYGAAVTGIKRILLEIGAEVRFLSVEDQHSEYHHHFYVVPEGAVYFCHVEYFENRYGGNKEATSRKLYFTCSSVQQPVDDLVARLVSVDPEGLKLKPKEK